MTIELTDTRRRSIVIDGFGHGSQPIPSASRLGPLLITGGVHGIDRTTGKVPEDIGEQVRHMFQNLRAIIAAGGTLNDVVKVTVFVAGAEVRDLVNVAWVEVFPDPESRPARHTRSVPSLPAGYALQCDATAFIMSDAERRPTD